MIPTWAQTKSFAVAATKHVLDGLSNVSDEDFNKRIGVCEGCDKFNREAFKCEECGCPLRMKAMWKVSKCPLNKW